MEHRPDSVRLWRNLFYALSGLTILLFLTDAFLLPGTLSYSPLTIQDDARQFLAWMPRIADPALLRSDLIADYFQAVSPPLYRWLYEAVAAIGIPPLVFARLLPVPLFATCAWISWRLALQLTGRPLAAFIAAGALMAFIIHEDSVWSATPRAFSPPLFLIFIYALLNRRPWLLIPTLFLLACFYPATALVSFGMLCLSLTKLKPRPGLELSARSMLLVGLSAVAILAAVLPFQSGISPWKPVLTLAEARAMPSLGTFDGRTHIVNRHGDLAWACSNRMGLLPETIPCWSGDAAGPANFLLWLPMLVLAWRAARRWDERPPEMIYSWALISGLAWWTLATLVAFKLHLPGRFTQRVFTLMEWLAIGQLIGGWIDEQWRGTDRRRLGIAGGLLTGGLLLFSFATPLPGLWRPSDPEAIKRIDALPPGSTVAGLGNDMSFVPALTGRAALASVEHAIPYHLGYYGPFQQRLNDTLIAAATADPQVLAGFIGRYRITVFAAEPELLAQGKISPLYAGLLPTTFKAAQAALVRRPSVLQQLAPDCTLYRGALVLLDGSCLAERARPTR